MATWWWFVLSINIATECYCCESVLVFRSEVFLTSPLSVTAASLCWYFVVKCLFIFCVFAVFCQNCYHTIQKEEEAEFEERWKTRRKSKKQKEVKLSAETRMVLGGLFVVLNFIYGDNFKFVDDYR